MDDAARQAEIERLKVALAPRPANPSESREDARWLAVYGAAFVAWWEENLCDTIDDARKLRERAERLADAELSTRSEHPFPKEP